MKPVIVGLKTGQLSGLLVLQLVLTCKFPKTTVKKQALLLAVLVWLQVQLEKMALQLLPVLNILVEKNGFRLGPLESSRAAESQLI